MKIAITGASGKTGFRIVEEASKSGYKIKQIVRETSIISKELEKHEIVKLSLDNKKN